MPVPHLCVATDPSQPEAEKKSRRGSDVELLVEAFASSEQQQGISTRDIIVLSTNSHLELGSPRHSGYA
jgi:hypothetical protein